MDLVTRLLGISERRVSRRTWRHFATAEVFEFRNLLAAGPVPSLLDSSSILAEQLAPAGVVSLAGNNVNLKGSWFSINSTVVYSPGTTVPFSWQVFNEGSSLIGNSFSVNIYLSRDASIDTSDTFVRGWGFGAGFPGYTYSSVVSDSVTLPISTDPFWSSTGYYYVGLVVDPYFQVLEYNEFDNSSTSWGGDYAGIYVSVPKPDLVGSYLTPYSSSSKPGESISLWAGITNAGNQSYWGNLQVDVYLSRDSVIGSDDMRLTPQTLYAYLPSGTTQYFTLTASLPSVSSPIWGESGTYYVGFVIDPDNLISESNEFNNINQGVSADVAPLTVETQIDLSQLPATTFQPGALLTYYYQEMLNSLNTAITDWNGIAKDASGLVNVSGVIASLNAMKSDLTSVLSQLNKLKSRKLTSMVLGPATTLDLVQVEQVERLLVYLFDRYAALGSTSVINAASAPTVAAAGDGLDFYKQVGKQILTDYSPNRLIQQVNESLGAAGKLVGGAGATALSKATGVVNAALNMARMGVGSITKGSEFEETARANGDTVDSVLWGDLKAKLNDAFSAINPDGARLKKLVEDAQRVGQTLKDAYNGMKPAIRTIYDRARSRWITGSWKGTVSSQGQFGTTTEPMTLTFKSWSLGRVQATISSFANVFDAAGNLIKKVKTSSTVSGGFRTSDKFEGTLTYKNTATGATESRPVTWTYDGGSFSGQMGSGLTTMKVKKR